jgi:hypothetical protein
MTERVRAKVRRVEAFLQRQKMCERGRAKEEHRLLGRVRAESSFAQRLQQMQTGPRPPERATFTYELDPTCESPASPSRGLALTARTVAFTPGQIIKNPRGLATQRSTQTNSAHPSPSKEERVRTKKNVTFAKDGTEVILVQTRWTEEYADIDEMQEAQKKRQLLLEAASLCMSERPSKIGKREALLEKVYGELKKQELTEDQNCSDGRQLEDEISRLSELNSTLKNELDNLRHVETTAALIGSVQLGQELAQSPLNDPISVHDTVRCSP